MDAPRQRPARRDARILVLAPTGRDGQLAVEVLNTHGLTARRCEDAEELCAEARKGAGAMLVAGEALVPEARQAVIEVLRTQPFWSELPVIVLARRAEDLASLHAAFDSQCNMTFLERPVQIGTLVSAAEAALRARQRQYEVRDLVEQLRETDRRKDEFLAMLGHELRNPLGVIRTALELLRNCDADSSPRQVIRIEHQISHLSRMVDDLLDLSRVSRGRITLRRRHCDLGQVAASALDTTGALARGRTIALHRPTEPLWVDGDPVRLEQIVGNLLQNALKYSPAEKPIVLAVERDGAWGVVRVRDEGIGIEPDQLEHIFETFTQLTTSLERSGGGLGLGLSLVRHLVRLHGGSVSASSRGVGKGSEFVVRLPLLRHREREAEERALLTAATAASAQAAPASAGHASNGDAGSPDGGRADGEARGAPAADGRGPDLDGAGRDGSRPDGDGVTGNAQPPSGAGTVELPAAAEAAPRVLVVEDLEDAREALGELLALYGFEVELAPDGPSGVEQAVRGRPDVALIDIGLPGFDGYQVARRVREALGSSTFLVAMTGYGQAEDRRRAREAGFDHHLVKPVSPTALLELLRRPRGGPGPATTRPGPRPPG